MRILILLFLILFIPSLSFATTATLQEGASSYAGTSDARIYWGDADTNFATETTFGICRPFSGNYDQEGLFKFDVSSIPSTAVVSSATLSLYGVMSDTNGYQPVLSAKRVFKPWTESGITWNDWINPNSEWGTAGARTENDSGVDNSSDGSGDDRKATAESSVTFTAWTDYTSGAFYDWTITSLVQGWVDGTMTNNGVIVIATVDSMDRAFTVSSSENATSGNRPKLTVVYTDAGSAKKIIIFE